MKKIVKIMDVQPYLITCLFDTGEVRIIDLESIINKYADSSPNYYGMLRNKKFFSSVFIDSYGTLAWPNELELDPDNLFMLSEPVTDYNQKN